MLKRWEAKVTKREVLTAWLVGGGVWVLGLLALVALSAQSAAPAGEFASPPTRAHYVPSQTATRYQDPSGKYTVVVRGPGPAIYF